MSLGSGGYKFDDLDWYPVKNTGNSTIPSFAVMKISGMTAVEGTPVYQVEKPDTNFQPFYLINGPTQIQAGKHGRGTFGPYFVQIDPSETSANYGTGWGVTANQWYVSKYRPGFTCFGGYKSDNVKRAMMKVIQCPTIMGKISGSDVTIWAGSTPAETTMKVSKKCWMNDSISGAYRVVCQWIGGEYQIVGASCDPDE